MVTKQRGYNFTRYFILPLTLVLCLSCGVAQEDSPGTLLLPEGSVGSTNENSHDPANEEATGGNGDPTILSAADLDGDGLTGAEEKACGTDEDNKDTDGDKLTDFEECKELPDCDPTLQDTDGNGVDDNLEVNQKLKCTQTDFDNDGHPHPQDCNDLNANINPDAADTFNDGQDTDCKPDKASCSTFGLADNGNLLNLDIAFIDPDPSDELFWYEVEEVEIRRERIGTGVTARFAYDMIGQGGTLLFIPEPDCAPYPDISGKNEVVTTHPYDPNQNIVFCNYFVPGSITPNYVQASHSQDGLQIRMEVSFIRILKSISTNDWLVYSPTGNGCFIGD